MLEAIPAPLYLTDSEGRVIRHNRAFAALLGRNSEQIAGWAIDSLVARVPCAACAASERQHTPGVRSYQATVTVGDGSHRDFLVYEADLTQRSRSSGASAVGTLIDITARVQAEQELRALKEALEQRVAQRTAQLDAILDSILSHVAYLDRDFRFVRVNETYARGCGHSAEELIGRNHFELFPNEENERIFTRVRDTGEPYYVQAKPFFYRDQPERGITYWDWWLRPVRGADGSVEGMVLSLHDVTAQERAREEVERLNAELAEADAAKDEFLAVLSHELRNPMSPILAGVEVLRRTLPNDARTQRTLAIIERSVRLQARLVDDLLDVSRISRGKIHLQQTSVPLDAVIRAATQTQQADAEAAGITLTTFVEPDLWVYGDPDRLQQVVMNLVSNAIKFTPAGGRVRVEAWACETTEGPSGTESTCIGACRRRRCQASPSERVCIVVEDTGIGIPPDLLPRLFDMFRQGEVGGQRKAGLGIGLALAKGIAELHGGCVRAESAGPGQGSRFVVQLPLVPPPQSVPAPDVAVTDTAPIRLLLVEDNVDTRHAMAESLTVLGYQTRAVGSGEEALRVLAQWRPDVLVSDIGLPGMDGYALLRQVRALPELKGTLAVAVTGYGRDGDVRQARDAGYDGHFVKPVDLTALDRYLRRRLAGCPLG